MIDRVLIGDGGRPLLNLWRETREQAMFVKGEGLPEIQPVGHVREVPGSDVRLYTGGDALRAGTYSLTVGTYGQSHSDAFSLQREVLRAAVRTRAVQRSDGGLLHIASFTRIRRSFSGSAQAGGAVDVDFEPVTPYWITRQRSQAVAVGGPVPVAVLGDAPAPLRITLTAGGAPVMNPRILSDAGLTGWLGTVPPGGALVIDATPGTWAVTLNGLDTHLKLQGPQPYLNPGERTLTITAPGAAATIEWQEGDL